MDQFSLRDGQVFSEIDLFFLMDQFSLSLTSSL